MHASMQAIRPGSPEQELFDLVMTRAREAARDTDTKGFIELVKLGMSITGGSYDHKLNLVGKLTSMVQMSASQKKNDDAGEDIPLSAVNEMRSKRG